MLARSVLAWCFAAFSGVAEPLSDVSTTAVTLPALAPRLQDQGRDDAMTRQRLERVVGSLKQLMLQNGVQTDAPTGLRFYTGYEYRTLYDIDLYFEGIILYYMGVRDYTKSCIRLFLEQQKDNGMIPRTVQREKQGWTNEEDLEHCKPFLAPPPAKLEIGADLLGEIRSMAATPTTAENLEERKALLAPHVLSLSQLMTLSVAELQEAYQAWATLTDPEQSGEVAVAAKAFDKVVAVLANHLEEIDFDELNR